MLHDSHYLEKKNLPVHLLNMLMMCVFVISTRFVCALRRRNRSSGFYILSFHGAPPFATSKGCLFVDFKRFFSVSFVIQIIIPISAGFDVCIAALCCVCMLVHAELLYNPGSFWSVSVMQYISFQAAKYIKIQVCANKLEAPIWHCICYLNKKTCHYSFWPLLLLRLKTANANSLLCNHGFLP